MTAPAALWRLTGPARILAAGSLLNAIAFFAAMPFGALYLDEHTGLGTGAIGAVIGSVALIGAFGGVLGGVLVDRIGAVRAMQAGLTVAVGTYLAFTVVRSQAGIIALFLGLGVARLLTEPASKHLMSSADDGEGRIFRVRYMALCAGAIVGPLLGGVLYSLSVVAFFGVPALFYGLFLLLVTRWRAVLAALASPAAGGGWTGVGVAVRDRALWAPILGGTVVFFVFSQLESMVPLLIRGETGVDAARLFAGLLIANAVLALALQPVVDAVSRTWDHPTLLTVGALGFATAIASFALVGDSLAWLFVGIVCWTVGEAVLLPMPDMAIHQLAPAHAKGAYFGLSELRYAGFFLGPLTGGLLLGRAGDLGATVTAGWVAVMVAAPVLGAILLRTSHASAGSDLDPPGDDAGPGRAAETRQDVEVGHA